ncbi:polysaccharide biosynthesis protein [Halobacillus locisalis]|uniref:Polysaccharide biosynthesis protein n=2 Tax=Halobacillus locisalis TaxID=220753 RepID=A0A838CZ79_9BACI|nr:polysaccharide biosynthesis protein [Halobacillus locisalis]
MATQTSSSIMKGAFLLTMAGLIGKVMSAGYRVPLQNITGDLGFYIYQQVYPILGIALVLGLYGFPAAVSKLTAEQTEQGKVVSFQSLVVPVFLVLSILCGSLFVVGYSQADALAEMMGDGRLSSSIQAAFALFLVVPFLSVLRGLFQGNHMMMPTAISQIIEQLIRVVGILMTAWCAVRTGDLYAIGRGASLAACTGSVIAVIVLLLYVKKNRIWSNQRMKTSASYVKTMITSGVLISLNYMLLLSLQGVDAFTLVPGLIESGQSLHEARVSKGVFDRGQPLIQLGTVLASSIALALIPSVSQKRLQNQPREMSRSIRSAIKFSFIIALGSTVGLILLFPTINPLFFIDTKGTDALQWLMLVILLSSMTLTTASILQGLDHIKTTALFILGGIVVKVLANQLLIPLWELNGAAAASIIAVAFVFIGNIVILGQEMNGKRWFHMPWVPVLVSISAMMLVVLAFRWVEPLFDHQRLLMLVYTLSVTCIGGMTYLGLLLKLGAFTRAEVQGLPLSRLWERLLPKGRKP